MWFARARDERDRERGKAYLPANRCMRRASCGVEVNAILFLMRILFSRRFLYVVGGVVLFVAVLGAVISASINGRPEPVTTTVTRGDVANIVSVSGIIQSEARADIAFPISDVVEEVAVNEGDVVEEGAVLATLRQADLQAQRREALANIEIARADRDELIAGPRNEAREVTSQSVAIAREELARVTVEEDEKVINARRTLLSSSLEALPVRTANDDTPPAVSGTYTCKSEGVYVLDVFRSSARSGYSYKLSGLETGIADAYTTSPAPLGDCGLSIQFAENVAYGRETWTVTIPNTRNAQYATNLNAYTLARTGRDNRVAAAQQALDLSLREEQLVNAVPRTEALRRANATIAQKEARHAAIEARIDERTLTAPFAGVITDVAIVKGETSGTEAVVTMVADATFELTARIPEIDITKIAAGQRANVYFDAQADKRIAAHVSFISPLATEIDGVAYFEAQLVFDTPPQWLKSGLNSDIDIVVDERRSVLRIPERFITHTDTGAYTVLVEERTTVVPVVVTRGFVGNDGFVEISGLNEGDVIVAPL